jgi:TRAP-type C4-dicarboxylate transport system permease small subunit
MNRQDDLSSAALAPGPLVTASDRHLKWPRLDALEKGLMILCGVCLVCFTVSTLVDVVTRETGHPLLWLQEVTSTFFTYGVFVGSAVATRRNDHLFLSALTEKMTGSARQFFEAFNRAVVLLVGIGMVWFGWQNVITGLGSFRMPSMLPMSYLYLGIPLCGALVALFSLEQIVNGLRHGFVAPTSAGMDAASDVGPRDVGL